MLHISTRHMHTAIEGVDLFDSEGTPMNLRTLGEAYASTRIKGNGVYILVVVKGKRKASTCVSPENECVCLRSLESSTTD